MKALSIRQPWAWAILHAGKDIENRTQNRRYRGELVIHAPAKLDTFDRWPKGLPKPDESVLHLRAILGVVELVDVVERSRSRWFDGPFGFVLAKARPLPEPVPYLEGNSSFWTIPPAVAGAIRQQLGGNGMAVVITRNGKAAAVLLVPYDDDDLERLMLARSPRFQALLERSRKSIQEGKGLSEQAFWEAVRKRRKNARQPQQKAAEPNAETDRGRHLDFARDSVLVGGPGSLSPRQA